MKRAGILNSDLSYLIATLGHTDLVRVPGFVQTVECTPFANVLLRCGVAF